MRLNKRSNATFIICFVLLLCLSALSYSSQQQANELKGLHENIPIGELGGVKLSINIAFPQMPSTKPRPVLIMIHGGGFLRGDKSQLNDRIQKMAGLGFVSASAMYRLAPEHKFPALLDDIKLAIRFIKAHAVEYHINPERIIVSGSSSGGYLAVMAGVTGNSAAFPDHGLYSNVDSTVHAVAAQSPPIADFTLPKYAHYPIFNRLIDPNSGDREKLVATMSPISYLDKDDPAFFLSHGDADPVVPVDMTREFVQELKNSGHPYEYHEVEGGTHSFNNSVPKKARAIFEAYLKFIMKWSK